jgi:hypothetical protein
MSENNSEKTQHTHKTPKNSHAHHSHRMHGGAQVGLLSSIKYFAENLEKKNSNDTSVEDSENNYLNTEISTLNAYKEESEGLLGVGKSMTAGTNLAEVKAEANGIQARASVLSAETKMEYGLNNEIGVDLALAKVESQIGPVQVESGIDLETSANVGVNGVGASVLGFGFNVGPSMRFKTPIFKFGVNLF